MGDRAVSPVRSARKNGILSKSSWHRIKKELKYHPYKPIRRHLLKPADEPRRRAFCHWILTRTDQQLQSILFSDEANFELSGHVNSQNVRRYAPLKSSVPINGGRPDHFALDKPTFSEKLMVFCGMKNDGTFGLKFYRNISMNGQRYHSLLQYHVLPGLKAWNNGNLDNLWWQQDGAPCHVTNINMRYLDSQFDNRVISRQPINGIDWPARSPDLNPCDFFLWGYLKSKVYSPKPHTLDDLENNIRREVGLLQPNMVLRSMMDIKSRARKCLQANGGHFEK
jgi:inhibitor of nuclear factor kappa-B kinase subunit alpha